MEDTQREKGKRRGGVTALLRSWFSEDWEPGERIQEPIVAILHEPGRDTPWMSVKNENNSELGEFTYEQKKLLHGESIITAHSSPQEEKNEASQSSENGSSTIQGESATYPFSEDWEWEESAVTPPNEIAWILEGNG